MPSTQNEAVGGPAAVAAPSDTDPGVRYVTAAAGPARGGAALASTPNAQRQAVWRKRQAQARQEALAAKGLPLSPPIPTMPGTLRWKAQHALARATLEAMKDEMQDYLEARTERWLESQRGQDMASRIEQLDDILATVEDLLLD